MARCGKTTGLKWTIAITVILVLALVTIVTYAICTKQIQYVEKNKDVIENVTEPSDNENETDPTIVENGTQAVIFISKI